MVSRSSAISFSTVPSPFFTRLTFSGTSTRSRMIEMRRFHNGEDTRYLPLTDRKQRLRTVVPKRGERLLYCDHVDGDGEGLFRLVCENDLEGIVAKCKSDPYLPEHANWFKIRNHGYSQWANREELFERERERDPDFRVWDQCALACAEG